MEGHPGIPDYDEFEADLRSGRTVANPAAHVAHVAHRPKAVPGKVVERTAAPGSIRPPGPPRPSGTPEQEATVQREIDAENKAVIAGMTKEEILEERERLRETLPPKLFEKWSQP